MNDKPSIKRDGRHSPPPGPESLDALITRCMIADRRRIRRTWKRNRKEARALLQRSVARALARSDALPRISYPEQLPVSEHRERLVQAIRDHQVLVVSGETGSGKSTQLPKLCLEAGRGVQGMIAHTQPRRIAARTVAERVAEELGGVTGGAVGYRVRFNEKISEDNYIRVLTDGMLLSEFESDPWLSRYDTLIIDEAHERSLNIDFLLGLAHSLLARRPELKLIITSATLDTERFAARFGDAPVFTVSGRSFPVELRYRPPETPLNRGEEGLAEAVHGAIVELFERSPGDTLVFLSGEREIRDVADFLGRHLKGGVEVLPLYARLTPAEQMRIFRSGHSVRVVLATNVAETSVTIPGIRYVVDTGLARISRYSPTRKIQRLPVEKISQSSANQRAGRCGRTAAGVCIRLYDEEDFDTRPTYTDPEIRRTSLANVILRMKAMGMAEVEDFPFIDAPDRRQINDGLRHLEELGALDDNRRITRLGRRIGRLPVDPRIARMLVAAQELDCLEEVLIIAAALSIPDPRLAPADRVAQARQKHRALSDETSDFLVLLDIWRQFRHVQKTLSRRKAWQWCQQHYLSVFRMREWNSLQASLLRQLKRDRFRLNRKPADPDRIHRALLTGLLSNLAHLSVPADKTSRRKLKGALYNGAHGKQLRIFPGSHSYGGAPKWIMASEMVETRDLYARTVAPIQPQWVEAAGAHLLRFQYSEPHWDRKQERVVAFRRASLYGLPVYSGRKCDFGKIDPPEARRVFIRSALVERELETRLPFYKHNEQQILAIEELEHKIRRRDLLVDDEAIFDFYDTRIPADVCSTADLRRWHRELDDAGREALKMTRETLTASDPVADLDAHYPDALEHRGMAFPLAYRFDPGHPDDGITATVKLPLLNQLNAALFDQLVPGLLEEKLVALVRALPRQTRRHFVPVPDTVERIIETVAADPRPLCEALAAALEDDTGVAVDAGHLARAQLPAYLKMKLRLVDEGGAVLGVHEDIEQLRAEYGDAAHRSFVDRGRSRIEQQGITRWNFGDLPASIAVDIDGYRTEAYPALVDHGDTAAIEIFDTPEEARENHREGVRRLLMLALPEHRRLSRRPLPDWQRISLMYAAIGDLDALQTALFQRAQDAVFFAGGKVVREQAAFETLVRERAARLPGVLVETAAAVAESIAACRSVKSRLLEVSDDLSPETMAAVESQLEWLVYDGFVDDVPAEWLGELPRYLQAVTVRLEQALLDPATDRQREARVSHFWQRFLESELEYSDDLERYRWMVEEYRVSVFAQSLGTRMKVSPARLDRLWAELVS